MIAIIFDVDGTLIESFELDSECYLKAVYGVLGKVHVDDDWSKYEKITDVGILRQIMDDNSIKEQVCIERVRKRFGEEVGSLLKRGAKCNPMRGAVELIQGLLADKRFSIGIATGGWGHTARMKLEYAGFDLKDIILYSCDDSDDRIGIMSKCLHKLGDHFERVVYIGDREWDLSATQKLDWYFIGIGSRLKNRCDIWIEDFSDYDMFINLLSA